MAPRDDKGHGVSAATAEALPDFNPWRAAGWIFRDGSCIAIERQGEEIRHRILAD